MRTCGKMKKMMQQTLGSSICFGELALRTKEKILGTILSPQDTETWDRIDSSKWLAFRHVTGLIVDGYGTIDGWGINWWSNSFANDPQRSVWWWVGWCGGVTGHEVDLVILRLKPVPSNQLIMVPLKTLPIGDKCRVKV
ncbi:hypothetical protein IFM89_012946 [Coptis chinensis]|uniref:Uncharacterized protein n=1 Tax=Coptis chinensis TaxID=261450 RepID=A0A835IVP5_9MAGN|nr:hypothetical protein IFM89_012946 [Coptis chinensis]